jgi:hypothetical protein
LRDIAGQEAIAQPATPVDVAYLPLIADPVCVKLSVIRCWPGAALAVDEPT